ncbi:MAG: linear amide C-N hydrolase [bacterium]
MKRSTKVLIGILTTLGLLIVIPSLTVYFAWNNEIKTISSIKVLSNSDVDTKSGPVYEMTVHGGYYFDSFVEQGGVSNDDELIDFIVGKLTKGLIDIELNAPEIGCAGVTMETEDGDRLFGRSYDFSPNRTSMIVTTNPGGDRYSSVSSVDLGFLGYYNADEAVYLDGLLQEIICIAASYIPLDGINEKGFSCGVLMTTQGDNSTGTVATDQNDPNKDNFTSTTMLRYMLDYCATVEEAIEFAKSVNLHDSAQTSFHYMIADETGASAVLEWVPENGTDLTDNDGTKRVLNVIRNDEDSHIDETAGRNDFQYVTNFVLTPGYYNCGTSKPGLDRYNILATSVNPNGDNTAGIVANETSAMAVLESVARRKLDKLNGSDDSNSATIWSALFNLSEKTMTWVGNEHFDDEDYIFRYELNSKGLFVRV